LKTACSLRTSRPTGSFTANTPRTPDLRKDFRTYG
jgi:hypothetical protein